MELMKMTIYEFEGKIPKIGADGFIYDEATIIGDVTLGDNVYVGAGAVIRGDYGTIVIGDGTAVEENCVLHARPGEILTIGKNVTIGHGAILHNCTIDDLAVIGMGSIVSDYAHIGEWAVVGEGAVVKNKSEIPASRIAVGVPAKVIAEVNDEYKEQWLKFKEIYHELARTKCPETLKKIG